MFAQSLFGSKRQPYTGAATKILLSFAMDNHGAAFAYWLRDKLMKRLNYFSMNAVYMDCISSRGKKTFHTTEFIPMENRVKGLTYVMPDTRDKFHSQGYMPIGGSNSEWNEMYVKAMSEAVAMVMVLTPEYMRSEWCMKEWGQFHEENQRRRSGKRPTLRGVALTFPPDGKGAANSNGMPANGFADIQQIPATKVFGLGGMLWHHGDFGIAEDSLSRLVRAMGPGV